MKKIIIIIPILILASFVTYKAVMNGYIRLNYPSFEKYPVHGIDISHHQHEIDWENIEKEFVQFVFIKSTEGATHQDTMFEENWNAAKKLNIPTSAYHFFTFCTSGVEQAQNFINTVPNDSSSLPPAIDLEFGGNCGEENRVANLQKEICDFIDVLQAHYKKKVIIYTTNEFYNVYVADHYPNNPIWIRDIVSEPDLKDNRDWLFWQYANRGRLKGITTFIDMNAFRGDEEELRSLIVDFIE